MTKPSRFTKIGKLKVEYFPQEVINLQKELDEFHFDLRQVIRADQNIVSTLNDLAGLIGLELDGMYRIEDVAEAIRVKLVKRRLIVAINSSNIAEKLQPIEPK